ncbi:MAG: hypothetical protein ACLUN0_10600 [Roseburia sp.]
MWLIFNKSFQKNLTEVLKFDTKESRTITAAAKKKYKELIDKLPELEKERQIQDEHCKLCDDVGISFKYAGG